VTRSRPGVVRETSFEFLFADAIVAVMGDWAVWAEADEPTDEAPEDAEPARVDETLEARRLSRWLKAMFGGPRRESEPDDGSDDPG